MADLRPSKDDIEAIFRKLRGIPTNKACFDCSAKNPTWATVTYGVFICIDCSAVHRSLGVHLTFVRSTQLDTNWTWLQLRHMQLGGNAAASVFFRQHNCVTADAQQKYTSRAAQLYKDKLGQIAASAMRIHGTELHLETNQEKPGSEEPKKDVDFFDEHSSFPEFQSDETPSKPIEVSVPNTPASTLSGKGPSVDLAASVSVPGERKSLIGGRKPKKTGLGTKKAGLGAQRVQTNFADIEREAEMIDQRKEKQEVKKVVTEEEEQEQIVSMRLAYQDLSKEQHKHEERLKKSDPKKAQQVERLGMGYSSKSSFTHSALNDMQTISQESPVKSASKPNYDLDDVDKMFDDFSVTIYKVDFQDGPKEDFIRGGEEGMPSSNYSKMFASREEKSSMPMPTSKSWYYGQSQESKSRGDSVPAHLIASSNDAQKKFGNAKAISSDQYFEHKDDNNYERKANLSRFEGSTSISSSDYFQDGRSAGSSSRSNYGSSITSSISAPDLDDVKESVRQGVTKVAGRITSLANGVINSIQDRYGY